MLSVIIATLDAGRDLVPTLAALVPGATAGLISEVLVADGGSGDETAAVADVAGCEFLAIEGPLGNRLKVAAETARAPWLMFLRPGTILDASWTGEARHFMEQSVGGARAAVFRRGAAAQPGLREVFGLALSALGARPCPQQGLIISQRLYREIGGHSAFAAEPEHDLLRRLRRSRIVTLSTGAFAAR